jgi:hypothetical protein
MTAGIRPPPRTGGPFPEPGHWTACFVREGLRIHRARRLSLGNSPQGLVTWSEGTPLRGLTSSPDPAMHPPATAGSGASSPPHFSTMITVTPGQRHERSHGPADREHGATMRWRSHGGTSVRPIPGARFWLSPAGAVCAGTGTPEVVAAGGLCRPVESGNALRSR